MTNSMTAQPATTATAWDDRPITERQLRAALAAGPILDGTYVSLWGDYDLGPVIWINDAAVNGGDPITLAQAEAMLAELARAVDAARG